MRLFIILGIMILAQLCPTKNANADFFVLYEKDSKEIIAISDKESNFVISEFDKSNLEIKQMSGEISDYDLIGSWQDYKISGNRIVVNTQKISDGVAKQELDTEIAAEKKLIDQKLKDLAIDELTKDGVILKHIKKTGE